MNKVPLKNSKGENLGDYELAEGQLLLDRGDHAVHEAIVAFNTHQRAGTASTLSKSNVNGTGAKPWKQKGLGRARAGYKQSPVWRGGAVAHGPHPLKRHKKVSKKVVRLAFKRALSAKIEQGDVVVVDELTVSSAKTKEFAAVLKNLGVDRSALFISDTFSNELKLSARNLQNVELATADLVNTYQVLRHKCVFITQTGMELLKKRMA